MHSGVTEHLTKKAQRSTTSVVSAAQWTIGGSMDHAELEELLRAAHMYNSRVSLEAGVLTIRLGR